MNYKLGLVVGATLGVIVTYIATVLFSERDTVTAVISQNEKVPLYWVAPMDDNYRRDKPGLSPMGMELVPVYGSSDHDDDKGIISIHPKVVNNLGVRTAKVLKAPWRQHIETVGYVQYDQESMVHIHPRVEGWVETLHVKSAGDKVEKGQPLYTLYSPQLVNAQEEFLIALKRDNKKLMAAAADRLKALQLSNSFIDNLRKTQVIRQSITFYASQTGVIDGLEIREGFYVKPGTTLMSLATLDQVWVEAEVFERDTAFIELGLPVEMKLDFLPNKHWFGEVDYIYPSLDATTRTLRVRLKFHNPEQQLKPNMFAQVRIATKVQQAQLQVPKEAVIRTGSQDRLVLALGEGKFKSVAIKIGSVNQDRVQIVDGVEEGDEIVTSAHFLLDSESSKDSDFKRINHEEQVSSVWVNGVVKATDDTSKFVTLEHDPIPQWGWPKMVMDFPVSENLSKAVWKEGATYSVEVVKEQDGDYFISDFSELTQVKFVQSATVSGRVNAIEYDTRIVNISRSAIAKWERPAATMDFVFAKALDMSQLKVGMHIEFTFEVRDDLVVIDVVLPDRTQVPAEGMKHD